MHITNGIIMNGTRIIMPQSLQQEYLQCLHMGHLGISKCRARAKTRQLYFGQTLIETLVNLLRGVKYVVSISMHLQVTTNILREPTFQAIYMVLIFVTLMERYTLYVWIISHFSFGNDPYQICNLIQ